MSRQSDNSNNPLPRRAYRVDEVAKMLEISRSAAYRLVADRGIRSFKVGKLIIVPCETVDDFLAQMG